MRDNLEAIIEDAFKGSQCIYYLHDKPGVKNQFAFGINGKIGIILALRYHRIGTLTIDKIIPSYKLINFLKEENGAELILELNIS